MSYQIYYTIRENKKTNYKAKTLFFGEQKFFDYKKYEEIIFDTYEEALNYFHMKNLDFKDYHIRKTISTNGGISHKDYIYKRR